MAAVSTREQLTVPSAGPPAPAPGAPASRRGGRLGSLDRPAWVALAVAGVLCFATFYARGGLSLETMTFTEIALTLLSGALVAGVILSAPRGGPLGGAWSVWLLLALAALSAISLVWSVQPNASWVDSGRMLTYGAFFAAAVALARAINGRWQAVLGGFVLAAVVTCAYAIATKVFPGTLATAEQLRHGRLEEPFGYWNAIGLTAAMGAVGCLWLGARRSGHTLLSALAYPGMGLTLLTLLLAYSRGALVALVVGAAAWFVIVPLRLRGAAVLLAGALGAGAVAAWAFSTSALSSEAVALPLRTNAGHRLGALTIVMLLVLALAGTAIRFTSDRRAPSVRARRRAGAALLALIACAVLALAAGLAASHRGFTGSISHAVSSLTDPNAKPPPNTPGRLTAVASVRARYWKEALQVFSAHPALGAGAMGYQTARLRYRRAPLVVAHAHGYLVQTLADLGAVGLALTLALLACWMAAAGRATHPLNRSWTPWRAWLELRPASAAGGRPGWRPLGSRLRRYTPERVGLLSMLCIVIVFGVHSLVDWTWYVPGDALAALLCAGWLAGRGPLGAPAPARLDGGAARSRPEHDGGTWRERPAGPARRTHPLRIGAAVAVVAFALLAAWSQWQPQRSEAARQEALELAAAGRPLNALAEARTAVDRDRLSALALFTLAQVQQVAGHPAQARATLERAVRDQPANPQTWLTLGRYDLRIRPRAAVRELTAAIYLDPESIAPEVLARGDREAIAIHNEYIEALKAASRPARPARLRSARGRRGRATHAARRASRRRPGR